MRVLGHARATALRRKVLVACRLLGRLNLVGRVYTIFVSRRLGSVQTRLFKISQYGENIGRAGSVGTRRAKTRRVINRK